MKVEKYFFREEKNIFLFKKKYFFIFRLKIILFLFLELKELRKIYLDKSNLFFFSFNSVSDFLIFLYINFNLIIINKKNMIVL